ncbi:MAG: T9SS type A sorting domain-containing protein [Flavobacteriaceae bacterium]|nr:T9SS type A sorting domain-containing protein [Flavobacteriaceae bacterium]
MIKFKYYFCFFLFLGLGFTLNAQVNCEEEVKEEILLIGDSWAFFMDFDSTFDVILPQWGHTNKTYYTNSILAENGATLVDFLTQERLDEIEFQLQERPDIKIVHLSLGGNDFLQNWNINFTDDETEDLKNSVIANLNLLIQSIKSFQPDIQIVWSGYTYTNFEEIISAAFIPAVHPFYSTWQNMGFPDSQTLNELQNDFSASIQNLIEADDQLDYISATGLMQYIFGQETPLEVAPFGTYEALEAPLPTGFINFPSPQASMRNYVVFLDCFHLSGLGYQAFINYQMQKHYHKALMDDAIFIANQSNLNGSVTSSTTLENELIVGNFNATEHKSILNFETENALNFNTAQAALFLSIKEHSEEVENIVFSVEVTSGFFGTDEGLGEEDFNFTAEASAEVCYFGEAENNHWLKLNLSEELLEFINHQNQTQIRLSLVDHSDAYLIFNATNNEEFAPVLNITYGDEPSFSVEESVTQSFKIYPNPTTSKLYFSSDTPLHSDFEVSIYSSNAQPMKPLIHENEIDISHFPNGVYILQIKSNLQVHQQKIIKE